MQVDEVGREHVHVEHLAERLGFVAGLFLQPVRGVVHDRPQAVGMRLELFDEGEDAGFVGEIGLQAGGAQRTQLRNARALLAIADDQRMTVLQQTGRAVQTDALAGAGDQDGSRSCAHASLVGFYGTLHIRASRWGNWETIPAGRLAHMLP
ncbi:hypothetical protein D3C78_1477010 [compost metagenome]